MYSTMMTQSNSKTFPQRKLDLSKFWFIQPMTLELKHISEMFISTEIHGWGIPEPND